jgi:hypothetical protein
LCGCESRSSVDRSCSASDTSAQPNPWTTRWVRSASPQVAARSSSAVRNVVRRRSPRNQLVVRLIDPGPVEQDGLALTDVLSLESGRGPKAHRRDQLPPRGGPVAIAPLAGTGADGVAAGLVRGTKCQRRPTCPSKGARPKPTSNLGAPPSISSGGHDSALLNGGSDTSGRMGWCA